MRKKLSYIALICARGGSKGIPKKNEKLLQETTVRRFMGLAGIPAVIWWAPLSLDIWPSLICFCLAGVSAQFCLPRSFGLAQASLVSPILFFRLPIVAAIAYYAFDQETEVWTWIGAFVIVISTTWMARRETAQNKKI